MMKFDDKEWADAEDIISLDTRKKRQANDEVAVVVNSVQEPQLATERRHGQSLFIFFCL